MDAFLCLRCKTVPLHDLPSPEGIRFLECPRCKRHYAKKPDRPMTFRWLHPITVALYGVIFDRNPVPRAGQVAESLASEPAEWRAALLREIVLELADPTQDLADTLDLAAPDAVLRDFLRELATRLETASA